MSDIDSNKIVVGVRFVKRNRIIHLEIQQATALPEGNVDEDSMEWIEAPVLDVNNETQSDSGLFKELSYEERALDLDRLSATTGGYKNSQYLTILSRNHRIRLFLMSLKKKKIP